MSATRSPLLATLAERNYARYAAGNAVSLIGTWMQRVAAGWLIWELTGSGTWLGLLAFADLAPAIILGPLGGAMADRVSPLRLTIVAQLLSMAVAIELTVLTLTDTVSAGSLTVLVLAQGLAMGFNQPARMALVYRLVGREHLPSAVAFNSVIFNGARFIGPAAAGAALVASGPGLAFAINAASFTAFIAALVSIRVDDTPPRAGAERTSIAREVADGARYTLGHPVIGALLVMSSVVALALRPYVELLPGFAGSVLNGGAAELALLTASIGLGAIIAGLWLAARGRSLTTPRFAVGAGVVSALAIFAFALSSLTAIAALFAIIAGGAMVMTGITLQTLIQLSVDTAFRGRVMSLYGLVVRSGPAFGALLMGTASEWYGLQLPIAAAALLALVCFVALRPTMRRVERAPGPAH